MAEKQPLDLTQIRARLADKQGRQFWRSLDEVAETPEFLDFLHREFPQGASEWLDTVSRRRFLKLMGASMALAGLTACSPDLAPTSDDAAKAPEKIVPYVKMPEEVIPGRPLFFATTMPFNGYGMGVLAESHTGRPTKIEGNDLHPDSLGATNVFAQASVLTLYDPDRSKTPIRKGAPAPWNTFKAETWVSVLEQRAKDGAGIRILTETVTSPTLAHQIDTFLSQYPKAKWHQYQPVNRDNVWAGAEMAFGRAVAPRYRFEQADVILSLDADFFAPGPGHIPAARQVMARRRGDADPQQMNRLYAVESTPTLVGAAADHRLAVRAGQVEALARAIAAELGLDVPAAGTGDLPAQWISAVAADLQASAGRSLVIAGDHQPPVVHALAHALNDALGNAGQTVLYAEPPEANPVNQAESLQELVNDMTAGKVDLLVILDANPVFNAPADLRFTDAMLNVPMRVHNGLYRDETAMQAVWHVPARHYLESWSDARAFDGTASLIQPLIAPLYDGKSAHELMDVLLGQPDRAPYDLLREYWQAAANPANFEAFWRQALHDGLIAGTEAPAQALSVQMDALKAAPVAAADAGSLEINFRPDPSVWDGRFANNGWLQELPRPLTKLTWDNPALLSPATAEKLGVQNGDMLELTHDGHSVQVPAWIWPGHADDSVTVHVGYGRQNAGQVGDGVGFNAYHLRTSGALWFAGGLQVSKTGKRYPLASVQDHHSMEGRDLVRTATLAEYLAHPDFAHETDHGDVISLYPTMEYEGNAWGMAIDLNACIGCNACTISCQAENNIPIVGKESVLNGREMHWIRLDRYYEGDLDAPETHHQPVLCMHCENAPCESVCPVAATIHSVEGLNEMTYNRCVGTRYCSNNCPYKVRRFNFLDYNDFGKDSSLNLLANPDVTVRSRGVMEKCTYCVQRINAARIEAKKEGREIRDGEIVTACQGACPTQAITFGNINDPNSRVAQLKARGLNYSLLEELNVRPRTTYLAKIKNPNPELEDMA